MDSAEELMGSGEKRSYRRVAMGEERDSDIEDRNREPMLATRGEAKLQNCDRP